MQRNLHAFVRLMGNIDILAAMARAVIARAQTVSIGHQRGFDGIPKFAEVEHPIKSQFGSEDVRVAEVPVLAVLC